MSLTEHSAPERIRFRPIRPPERQTVCFGTLRLTFYLWTLAKRPQGPFDGQIRWMLLNTYGFPQTI